MTKEIEGFLGEEIVLKDLIPINLPETYSLSDYLSSEYKIIVYIDSMSCSSCLLNKILPWQKYFESIADNSKFMIIFNNPDVFHVRDILAEYKIEVPYFLDVSSNIKKSRNFPQIEVLRTFLLHNNKVTLVGDPANNKKMMDLYINTITNP